MGTRILWQRFDLPGHEISALGPHGGGWQLSGTVLVAHDNLPCHLNYHIDCNSQWQTELVRIRGHIGTAAVSLNLSRSPASLWYSKEVRVPELDGCIDVDLGFSPCTNLLPIRRLDLDIGSRANVRAAWVRFPQLSLEVLEQAYTRIDVDHYRYESADGAFRRELLVNADGFVLHYPDYWRADAVMRVID